MNSWRLSLSVLLFLAVLGFSGKVDADEPDFEFRFDNPIDGTGDVDPGNIVSLTVEIENLITDPREFQLVITNNNDLQNNGLNAWWSNNGNGDMSSKSQQLPAVNVGDSETLKGITVSIEASENALYDSFNVTLRCRDNHENDTSSTEQTIQLTVNVNEKVGVSLEIAESGSNEGSVEIDGETTYQVQVNNNGNRYDVISLATSSNEWDCSLADSITVAPFSNEIVTLTVWADIWVNYGDSNVVNISATSGNSEDAQGTLDVTTFVRVQYGLGLEAVTASASGEPGVDVLFNFQILNKWSESVNFEITKKEWYRGETECPCNGWGFDGGGGTLDSFEEKMTSSSEGVRVTIASSADAGEVVTIIVQAKVSDDNDNIGVIELVIEVRVIGEYNVALILPKSNQIYLDVGNTISLSQYVRLKNFAKVNDVVTITAEWEVGGDDWMVYVPDPMVIGDSEEKNVFISVQAPENAAGSQAMLKIRAESGGDSSKYDEVTIELIVEEAYNYDGPETEEPLYDFNKTSTNDSGEIEGMPSLNLLTALVSIGLIARFRRK